jgi:hypothetical protein
MDFGGQPAFGAAHSVVFLSFLCLF